MTIRERPILFSAPMVRAILNSSKTQTRRVVKPWTPRPNASAKAVPEDVAYLPDFTCYRTTCPYGQPGDRLRVKEAAWMWCERRPNGKTKTGRDKWVYVPMREAPIHYAADHPKKPAIDVVSPTTGNTWGWRLKIGRFLPRWASRITLEITEVRVERLQDISEGDALAEGVSTVRTPEWDGQHFKEWRAEFDRALAAGEKPPIGPLPSTAYRALWDEINGPGSWDANPWVWAVSFKRVEAS